MFQTSRLIAVVADFQAGLWPTGFTPSRITSRTFDSHGQEFQSLLAVIADGGLRPEIIPLGANDICFRISAERDDDSGAKNVSSAFGDQGAEIAGPQCHYDIPSMRVNQESTESGWTGLEDRGGETKQAPIEPRHQRCVSAFVSPERPYEHDSAGAVDCTGPMTTRSSQTRRPQEEDDDSEQSRTSRSGRQHPTNLLSFPTEDHERDASVDFDGRATSSDTRALPDLLFGHDPQDLEVLFLVGGNLARLRSSPSAVILEL